MYCGEPMETGYDDYHPYHYCDCKDCKKIETINKQIKELEDSKPKEKYIKETKSFLMRLED